ncbi:hypothetical protein QZH41_003856 [Actinostola sp. cb2023]|nr:hypothetical protein QZH41_003856 [Actinostola sp. cb2023]
MTGVQFSGAHIAFVVILLAQSSSSSLPNAVKLWTPTRNPSVHMDFTLRLAFLLCLTTLASADTGLRFNETNLPFAEYRPWDLSTNGAMEIYFKTAKRYALLLYQDDGEGKDWIDVFLVNGKARLRLRMGTCDRENTLLNGNFTDSKWHHLRVKRNFSLTSISVDGVESESLDCKNTAGSPAKPKPSKSSMYLGGIPLLSKRPGHWSNPNIFLEAQYNMFTGCIARVRYSNGDKKLRRARYKNSIGTTRNCQGACTVESTCKNGGKCIDLLVSMRCDCLGTGYVGKYCEEQAHHQG